MKNKFELEINKQADILLKAERQFNIWGYVKLALCVLFVVTSCFMIAQWNNAVFKIGAGSLFIIQIFAWIYHVKLGDTVLHAKGIIEINERYISRIDGKWVGFNDDGKDFADQEHPYCNDLDIMGNKSLFQFLNTARTWHGRQAFANSLLHANYSQSEIKQRQEAVKELAERTVFTAELEYQFSRIGGDPAAAKLVKELQDCEPFIKNKVIRTVLILMPVIVLIITGFTVIFHLRQLYPLSGILLCLQSLLGMTGIFTASKYLLNVNRLPFRLNAYIDAITLISNTEFKSKLLRSIQDKLTGTNGSAAKAIKELAQIFDKASIRGNPLIYYLLNILLLWDFECAFLYQDWKKKYSVNCEEWFFAIGELESLSSLSVLQNVCSRTCYPNISENNGINASELGHPLISNDTRVTNPAMLNDCIQIISGSNMSGKTTYLRTIGINLILAGAGGPVCAEKMTFSNLRVVTSMRIADDLNEGISTFYAELKRIKLILDSAKKDPTMLFLIDEIFRGTNSVDRLAGARAVIKKLSEFKVTGMITTHDLGLCDITESVSRVRNYSFSEFYEQGRLCFDYKLREGISKTTSAKYLMEILNIL